MRSMQICRKIRVRAIFIVLEQGVSWSCGVWGYVAAPASHAQTIIQRGN